MAEPWVALTNAKHWRPDRLGYGDKDIVVRGTGAWDTDDDLLQAALTQLNSWGTGRLILDGDVIQTTQLSFVGNQQLMGLTPSARILCRCTASPFPIVWNYSFSPAGGTTYSFSMESAYADRFAPSGVTLADGDWVALWSSDGKQGLAAHNGWDAYQYPMEIHQVYEWDGNGGYGHVSDPVIEYMTTSPLMAVLSLYDGIMISNIAVEWDSGSLPGNYKTMFYICGALQPRVYNVRTSRQGVGSLAFRYCADIDVDCYGLLGQTNTADGYDGTYGITLNTVNGGKIRGSYLCGSRHAVTTIGENVGSYDRRGSVLNVKIDGNVCFAPTVNLEPDPGNPPDWDERVILDTHAEGDCGLEYSNNLILLTGTTNNVGIQIRCKDARVIRNTILGGYKGSDGKPVSSDGIILSGSNTCVEGNYIERVAVGIRGSNGSGRTDWQDYEVYTNNCQVRRNVIRDCRYAGILLAGSNNVIDDNDVIDCGKESGTSPHRRATAIQLGAISTSTVTDFTGDTLTTSAAHGMKVTCRVRFRENTGLPAQITPGTHYWVVAVPSTTQMKVSAAKNGTPITFTTTGGTNYVEGYHLPGSGIQVTNNRLPKGTNSSAIAVIGADVSDVEIAGNTARGYGSGTSIFDDAYGESAAFWAAYANHNLTDDGYVQTGDDDYKVVLESDGILSSYDTLAAAVAAASAGDTIIIPKGGCGLTSYVTISLDDITVRGAGVKPRIYRGSDTANTRYLLYIDGDRFRVENIDFDGVASGTNTEYGQLVSIVGDDAEIEDCIFENAYTTASTSNCFGLTLAGNRARAHRCVTRNNHDCYAAVRVTGDDCVLNSCRSFDDIISIYGNFASSTKSLSITDQYVYASTAAYGRIRIYNTGSPGYLDRLSIDQLVMDLPNFDLPASSGALELWNVVETIVRDSRIYHPTNGTNDEPSIGLYQDCDRVIIDGCELSGNVLYVPRNRDLVSIDDPTDVITCSGSHGMAANRKCIFYNSTPANLPTGINPETIYFVRNPSGADLQISETYGGSAKALSSVGSGTSYVYGLLELFDVRNSRIGKDASDNYSIHLYSTAERLVVQDCRLSNNLSTFIYFTSIPSTARWNVENNRFVNEGASTLYVMASWIKSSGLLVYADNQTDLQGAGSVVAVSNADQLHLTKNHGSSRKVYAGTGTPPSTTTVTWNKGDRWLDLDADAGDNGAYVVVTGGLTPTWKYETTIES